MLKAELYHTKEYFVTQFREIGCKKNRVAKYMEIDYEGQKGRNMEKIKFIGSLEAAQKCIDDAVAKIPAYQKFLSSEGKTGKEPFFELPYTSKDSYLKKFPYEELLPTPLCNNVSIFSSSGSSGKKPFYWVYLKEQLLDTRAKGYLENLFAIDKKKTLFIVGLSLGSWVGGDPMSFTIKTLALTADYPVTVITPGTNLDEIITVINDFGKFFDQLILLTSPTVLAHVILMAEHEKKELHLPKMRYVLFEEGFTEDFRIALQKKANVPETEPLAYSLYASADTFAIGLESPGSIALRKLCFHNRSFADSIGIEPDLPHFFHVTAKNALIESKGDELCVTRWQGVPLMRYNLRDRAYLYSWAKVQEAVKEYKFTSPDDQKFAAIIGACPSQLPDLVIVFGRADSCINLGGTKIYEYLMDDVIRSAELSPYLTGLYNAKLAFEGIHSYVDMVVEIKENVKESPELIGKIEDLIEMKLADLNQEFRNDYEKLYKNRAKMMGLKSVKLRTVCWPALSSKAETTIKIRGITPTD